MLRYAVMPLSPNSGLIEWVPDCDTLHALVRDYRDSRKILLNIEQRLMLAMAPDYDNLQLMGKVEVFQHALANTTGQDLNKVLWLKSNNAEDWLDRRTNYTRSLALMSMVSPPPTEMCGGSEAGSYVRLIDFVYQTSKQSPKSMWTILPEYLWSIRFEGCLSPSPIEYPTCIGCRSYTQSMSLTYEPASEPLHISVGGAIPCS